MEPAEYVFHRTVETERNDYRIRDAVSHDANFVRSSWKKSYYHQHPEKDRADIARILDRTIDALEKSGELRTLVACSLDRPDFILGFACYDTRAVHYVYVRELHRKNGVARELVKQAGHSPAPTVCTHWTRAVEAYQHAHPVRLAYKPSLLVEVR
jgi:GNAT superfamily N-acetyltransferase